LSCALMAFVTLDLINLIVGNKMNQVYYYFQLGSSRNRDRHSFSER
jgi:hypothetical protein